MSIVLVPFPVFNDTDGTPLEDGNIYIGTAGADPKANPITVYWDAAFTQTAAQPIRTLNGTPVYQGAPRNVYVNADTCSLTIEDKNGSPILGPVDANLNLSASEFAADLAAVQASAAEAAGSAVDAAAAASASEASAVVAQAAAALATGSDLYPVYADVAAGIAGVADAETFLVAQDSGSYHNRYTRSGTNADFVDYLPVTTAALQKETNITSRIAAYAAAPSDVKLWVTSTADRMAGRGIENVNSTDPWTLNVVDSLYLRDEEGNTTPTRTISTNTDPLGNLEAMQLVFTSGSQNLEQIKTPDDAGMGTYNVTVSGKFRSDASTESIGIGATNRGAGSYTPVTLSTSWQASVSRFTGYSSASGFDIGALLDSGATTPVTCDYYGNFVAFDSGPLTVPSDTVLRAENQAGHAKAALGRPGAITLDSEGWAVSGGAYFDNIVLPLARPTVTSYTFGCWVDFTYDSYAGSYAATLSFGNTPDTGTTTLLNNGAVGMDVVNYGRGYFQPSYSTSVARVPTFILDQGPVHMVVRVENTGGSDAVVTQYLNGVPLDDVDDTIAAFSPEVLMFMSNAVSRKRRQDGNGQLEDGDRGAEPFWSDRALSEDEISQIYLAGKATVGANAVKNMLVMGSFDSLTEFSDSPFWDTIAETTLRPGTFSMLDARGGSFYGSGTESAYESESRRGLRQRALKYAAKHHDVVYWFCQYGTNDIGGSGREMDPVAGGVDKWMTGRATIDAMILEDVASVPAADRGKIKLVLTTIVPRGDWAASDQDANDVLREASRVAYNADCLANFASRGYDYVLDWEDYIPSGFASLQDAAVDAYENGANTIFDLDGIHWEATGGADSAAAITVPFLQDRLTEIQA